MVSKKPIIKKKKPAKPKSEAALKNDIRARMRQTFIWYGMAYKKCKNDAKISYNLFQCSACGTITKKIEVDHFPPIIRTHEKTKEVSLDDYFNRLFCFDGITKVRALCCRCHSEVSEKQNQERLANRKSIDL